MKKASLKERLSYWFDNVMARGTASLVLLLACVTIVVVLVVTSVATLINTGRTIPQLLWTILRGVLSPGMPTGSEGTLPYVLLLIVVTLCGIFITSGLISILNTGLAARIRTLRKGHSRIIASDHTVVLGYNETSFTIVSELVAANANHKKQVVVIIDNQPKDTMDDEIRKKIPDQKTTQIICRTGNINVAEDLRICSIETAQSIIVSDETDFRTVKAVMAATAALKENPDSPTFLTAVIRDHRYVKAAQVAGGGATEVISFHHDVAQIIAHCCRYAGLSGVFTELFNNQGYEFYIEPVANLAGVTFAEASLRLSTSTLVGLVRDGVARLNPGSDIVLSADDQMVVIAEDDGVTTAMDTAAAYDQANITNSAMELRPKVKLLVLGYNPLLRAILRHEDDYLSPGSEVTLANEEIGFDTAILQSQLHNIQISTQTVDLLNHAALEELLNDSYDNVLLLTDGDKPDEDADSKVLMLLLMLRAIAAEHGYHFTITSEMRNVHDQELAKVDKVCDFVVSSHLASLIAVQVSQSRALAGVFRDLLDAEGSQLYLRPAEHYIRTGVDVDMATITAAASQRDEVFIGYQTRGSGRFGAPTITLNPPKSEQRVFTRSDTLVVLSQH
ncbi:MAG: hypothetical protein LBV06_11085 [Propionibacteriaceae bacterium]|jgi:Trk K+ transport system NAD-binding subunit|nr:hypothetical protein [Propionibacteriaceae bacterium]